MDFVHRPDSKYLENTRFLKFDLFPFLHDGKEATTLLGPLEKLTSITVAEVTFFYCTQQSRCLSPLHLKTETDPVSGNLCFLVTENSGRWTASTIPAILSKNNFSGYSVRYPNIT
jgi:hypothetical protein